MVEAVLFDVDDTLIDTAGAFLAAMGAIRRAYLPHVDESHEPEMLAIWRNDVNGHYRAYTRAEIDMDTQRRLRADELHHAFGGPHVGEDLYPQWLEIFWGTFKANWRAHDDVIPVLTKLKADGIRLGVVSNANSQLQDEKLTVAGLTPAGGGEDWFGNRIVGVDLLGFGKPDKRIFLAGCESVNAEPSQVAYVGDEPDIDAKAAANAGLLGVWLDRPGVRRNGPSAGSPSDATGKRVKRITTLAELPGVLGLL